MKKYQLFLDLDGVLVDFERGVLFHTGKTPQEQTPKQMWSHLCRVKGFYSKLEWMKDGYQLWESAMPLDPVILTGLPLGKWAEPQKREWCQRELGSQVEVICGMSRDKHLLAWDWLHDQGKGDYTPLLIDDRLKIRFPWEESGGEFILHFTTEQSLKELEKYYKD